MKPTDRLIDLTVADLERLMQEREERLIHRLTAAPEQPAIVEGIKGIAELYHCSTATAQRIKNSGKIDAAITQVGRKILVNTRMALAIYQPN
jgi:hypothetical protein